MSSTKPLVKAKAYALESITLDDELQLREGVVQSAIEEYFQVLKDGGRLPPISCVLVDGELLLVDGFARYYAHEKAQKTRIYVNILPGNTRLDAIIYACRANAKHGVPRSNKDKSKAVKKAIEIFPDATPLKLSEICLVSRQFVYKCLSKNKESEAASEVSEAAALEVPAAAMAVAATSATAPAVTDPKQGSVVPSPPEYKALDCEACFHNQFVLTDGGWQCSSCLCPEPKPKPPLLDTLHESPKVEALDIDAEKWKKWKKIFGQLTRSSEDCGLYIHLQIELAALKKKAMELAE
jgi:hypothetical protein